MAVDEAVMLTHGKTDGSLPTFRLYRWDPPTVSLGYFQKAEEEVDEAECRRLGIDVVRRLTGGRAVLHDVELTYSIVVREDTPGIPPTITASYCHFSRGLVAGLQKLGVDVQMTIPRGAYGQRKKENTSSACFDAPSHYEVTYEGKKLIGSAQVRKNGVILQHGSLLLRFSPEKLASILHLPNADTKARIAMLLGKRATALEDIMDRPVEWSELAGVIRQGMAETLNLEWEDVGLTEEEEGLAQELALTKYSQSQWNKMR